MYKSFFYLVLSLGIILNVSAQADKFNYSEENQIYRLLPEVTITTADGNKKLSELYNQSPLIIALVYTRCSGICNPFLLHLSENISEQNTTANFKIVVISFDSADRMEDMQKLSIRYQLEKNKRWVFAITPQIELLDKSIGFSPVWDNARKQFDHEALLVGVNQEGYIIKKLTGIRNGSDIALLIKELNGVFSVSYPLPGNNSIFSCFHYNPVTAEKKLSLGFLLLIAPFVLSIILVFIIGFAAGGRSENILLTQK
jgi:cytochrome oxidase Cu insertion factor (SCO1/SenC/PrrC family)